MAFAGITIVFDLVEMVLLCTRKLGPITHLGACRPSLSNLETYDTDRP